MKKDKFIQIRVTEEEKEKINKVCKELDTKLSDLILSFLLDLHDTIFMINDEGSLSKYISILESNLEKSNISILDRYKVNSKINLLKEIQEEFKNQDK